MTSQFKEFERNYTNICFSCRFKNTFFTMDMHRKEKQKTKEGIYCGWCNDGWERKKHATTTKINVINILPPKLQNVKGCGMGPWLVLVSPCFRENVVATCKIGSFLCNLDNLLQKNVIVFFLGNQISKWRSFEKKGYFSHAFRIF